jgi:site-specific recombinase XerC
MPWCRLRDTAPILAMNTLARIETSPALPAILAAELEQAVEFSRAAKSAATIRAYQSDWRVFTAWCGERGLAPMPAMPETVAAFLAQEATRGTKASTISRRVAAIRYIHSLANQPSPTAESAVKTTLQGIRRKMGVAPVKKAPATSELVIAMAAAPDGSPRALRDRAILLLGFAGGFRRSELVALNVEDIAETPEGLRIVIRRSKTDQEGAGQTKPILRGSIACPVAALERWLEASGIVAGPIFRRVRGKSHVGPDRLTDGVVAAIVTRARPVWAWM